MLEHDVLVIGAGLAGMRAAIAAQANGANTAIISKVHPVRSHSNAAQVLHYIIKKRVRKRSHQLWRQKGTPFIQACVTTRLTSQTVV